MPVLKLVGLSAILEQVKPGLAKAIAIPAVGSVWRVCIALSDDDATIQKSKFFKSIKDEIDDSSKRATFVQLVTALGHASNLDNYHAFFGDGGVECKEAHAFQHNGSRIKILELKRHRKKERLYFFPLITQNSMRIFVPLLAYHKRDETTPAQVANSCQTQVAKLLNAGTTLQVME